LSGFSIVLLWHLGGDRIYSRLVHQGKLSQDKILFRICDRVNSLPMLSTDLEKQLLALSPAEKAQAIQLLVQSLSNTWQAIEKTPGVCGGDACIAGTRIPVWSLVIDRSLGMSDARILEAFPHLTAADLVNAWAYAAAHPDEIEQAIRENEEV
jgi:uncharacterized protein (DUF433 family)